MSTVLRTSEHSVQVHNGPGRSTLNFTSFGHTHKISVNFTGPRGGNQQALIVDADDILEALVELDAISEVTARSYVEIITDGRCPACCAVEIPLYDVVCDDCFEAARAQRRASSPPIASASAKGRGRLVARQHSRR